MTKDELKKEFIDFWHKTFNVFVLNDSQAEKICEGLLEPREKRIEELEAQIEKMKCCENCSWYYLQQHWRESEEINENRMFHCGTCGNKKNWKLKEIKEK